MGTKMEEKWEDGGERGECKDGKAIQFSGGIVKDVEGDTPCCN